MNMIKKRQRSRGQGGFTLIELLVVIAILGILAGVVVFAVSGIGDSGQDAACDIDERTVKTAVEAYRAENNEYPANEAALVPGFLDSQSANVNYALTDGNPTYTRVGDCAVPAGD